jgi:hypothetical protein
VLVASVPSPLDEPPARARVSSPPLPSASEPVAPSSNGSLSPDDEPPELLEPPEDPPDDDEPPEDEDPPESKSSTLVPVSPVAGLPKASPADVLLVDVEPPLSLVLPPSEEPLDPPDEESVLSSSEPPP